MVWNQCKWQKVPAVNHTIKLFCLNKEYINKKSSDYLAVEWSSTNTFKNAACSTSRWNIHF